MKKTKNALATVYTLDNFDINLSLRVGMISLGNLNPQYIRHSFTYFYALKIGPTNSFSFQTIVDVADLYLFRCLEFLPVRGL